MSEQLIGERYQIITTLGSGRFGQTYLAEDRYQFELRCVIKKLQPLSPSPETWWAATQLFEQCAQTQYSLGHHPQIPQLLAYFQEHQTFYFVLEWIEGDDLRAEIRAGKQFSESKVIALLQDILKPLTFVHQQQVIHQDINPSNLIRRQQDSQIVLIDFGAVKELAATEVINSQGKTKIITPIGTPGYMPREQSRGQARLNSDVYAVGIMGIQALTGKMAQELPEDTETGEISWRKGIQVNPELSKVLDKMVRDNFRERYSSALEALAALQQLTPLKSPPSPLTNPPSTIPIPPPSQPPPTEVKSTVSHSWARRVGIALAILLVGLGGWYAYRQLSLALTLRTIQKSKQIGNYSQCISRAQAVSPHSPLSDQLLTLRRDCQNLQAQSYLAKARQLAVAKEYEQAKEELKRIAPDTIVYAQAQALLKRWNPANHEFYQDYQSAMDYLAKSDYQQALEKLYLAADKAIIFGQSDLLLAEMLKQEQGIWQPVAQSAKQWLLLQAILMKAEPNNYQLTYQRALLQLDGEENHHPREFELLFTAARQAIDNQQSDRMLSQLKQDQQERFKNLASGYPEWLNLLKALEQNNKQWLEH